jgi:hypothetical protein
MIWRRPAPYYIKEQEVRMMTKSKIALTAAVILGAASAALAKDSGPPNIDIQKTCRESSSALSGLTGRTDNQDFDVCMSGEQAALEQLTKNWADYPALAKGRCAQPKEFLPGYVEWQVCIEMTRDVIKLRKEQAVSTPASSNASRKSSSRRTGSETRECPIVKIGEDGSIDWVINC